MFLSLNIFGKSLHLLQCVKTAAKAVSSTVRHKSNKRKKPTDDLLVSEVLITPEEAEERSRLHRRIMVIGQPNIGVISGMPEEHLKNRRVHIFKPPKNAMQSGRNNIHHWQIEFDTRERWENPLIGWSSTGDPLSNMQLSFGSEEEAIEFCEKHGMRWSLHNPTKPKKFRAKNYGNNFAYDKRTRTSTK